MSEILFIIPKYFYFATVSRYLLLSFISWFCPEFFVKDMNIYLASQILTAFPWRTRKKFYVYGNFCLYDFQLSSAICLCAIAPSWYIVNVSL